jgi:hypothetical protein
MAKRRRSAAQRAAFKRMVAGLKRHRSKKRRSGRSPSSGGTVRRRRRRRAAPRRAYRRAAPRRIYRTSRRRRGGGQVVVVMNPRRRRARITNPGRRVRFRRHNPGGVGGIISSVLGAGIPALLAGGATGFVDAKFLSSMSPIARIGSKVALAAAIGLALRKRPALAGAAMAGVIGTLGYETGVRVGGGVVATSKPEAMSQLGILINEDPRARGELGAYYSNMGALVPSSAAAITTPSYASIGVNLG